jgi:pleiotropic regulator 1
LSGVYTIALHPTLDIIVTGGRDCVARVWDLRSRNQIFCLEGHNNTIASVVTQEFNPQIITGSHDSTIKLWDMRNGKCLNTLTHHKKSIRSLAVHDQEYTFISGKT